MFISTLFPSSLLLTAGFTDFFSLLLLSVICIIGAAVIWKQTKTIDEMRRKIPSEEQLTARNKIILSLEEVLKGRQEDLERIQNILRDRLTMVEDLDKKVAEFQNEMRAAEAMTRLHRDHYNYWESKMGDLHNDIIENMSLLDNLKDAHKIALLRSKHEDTKTWKLEFDDRELFELKELAEVVIKLSNPVPLYKAIYEIYYRNKMRQLIGAVGVDGVSGIYRIWLDDGRSYVGQSVDVGERWIQHLKRGLGAEEGTSVMLYPAMRKFGVQNFNWELIEKVEKDRLSERERYWVEFYAAKETGFNIKG